VASEAADRARSEEVAFNRAILAVVSEVVYAIDLHGTPVGWSSPVLLGLMGWSPDQLENMGLDIDTLVLHSDDIARVLAANDTVGGLCDGEVLETRFRLRHVDGRYRWVSRRLTPLYRNARGVVTHAMAAARDVSDAVQLDERLTRAALHDALTGLPSRALLLDRLATALQRRSRTGGVVPVLFCDLDGFKRVNDISGHLAGDEVLVATAERLRGALRPQDTVARIGGDEFVVILESNQPSQGSTGELLPSAGGDSGPGDIRLETLAIIGRLIEAVSEPVSVHADSEGATAHTISVSIGVTFAAQGSDPEEVLRQADIAMYRAKASGKDRYQVFDGSFRAEVVERGHIEQSLRVALAESSICADSALEGEDLPRDVLSVMYQPIFNLSTMQIIGVEVLARLTDAFGVALPPDEFIAVAEKTGLIAPLGRNVLEVACRDLAGWHALFPAWGGLGIAVNLTARQLGLVDLVADVRGALGRSELAPGLLTLELAESTLLDADPQAMTALSVLQADGVQIAIDDFGTGYASLRYLAQLPVGTVKVDQSFTAGLPADPTSVSIVRAVAGLARDLGMTCVVEGIETPAQLQALPAGVQGQGFLLGRPLAAADLSQLLEHYPVVPAPGVRSSDLAESRLDGAPSTPATTGQRRSGERSRHRQRDRRASQRDDAADQREDTADLRERLADRRDRVADQREARGGRQVLDLDRATSEGQLRRLAALQRAEAQGERGAQNRARGQAQLSAPED
jgi:PAS domain S-box-containing protein